MQFDTDRRKVIYERTDGHCHICHQKLVLANYGQSAKRGAWEVEHSRPRSRGGTDHGNNLYPACIQCNRQKGTQCTRTARGWNGKTRAPYSKSAKKRMVKENIWLAGTTGFMAGAAGGPIGALAGFVVGFLIGADIEPPKA